MHNMMSAIGNYVSEYMRVVRFCLAALCAVILPLQAMAEVVTVEDGSGAGFLLRQGGNCYVVLPTHVHGKNLRDIRLGSENAGGPIGSARIVYIAPHNRDISLGLVRGGLRQSCGDSWRSLPRNLLGALTPGTPLILQRPRQMVFEGRQLLVHSSGPEMIRLVPAPGERSDLFGGTSGAVAFQGTTPVAMVLQAGNAAEALAIRFDAISGLIAMYLDDGDPGDFVAEANPAGDQSKATPQGDPIEAESWSAHPVEGAADPIGMLAGTGPWIFDAANVPVTITLKLTDTDRLSQIRLVARAGTEHGVPREISITTDSSRDAARPRPSPIPVPEMTSDGAFDVRIGERFAHTITITIHSGWGSGDTIRLDAVSID